MDNYKENIILASSSPRRIAMFKDHGFNIKILSPNVDESFSVDFTMEETVTYLALKKARAIEKQEKSKSSLIVAADTVVYKTHIIGKLCSKEEAFNIFRELRNTYHYVATGVALIYGEERREKSFCEVTKVFFKDYSDEDILDYIKTDEPWDKAGGYAIQGAWGKHVDHIEGDINNVVGFPWDRFIAELTKL